MKYCDSESELVDTWAWHCGNNGKPVHVYWEIGILVCSNKRWRLFPLKVRHWCCWPFRGGGSDGGGGGGGGGTGRSSSKFARCLKVYRVFWPEWLGLVLSVGLEQYWLMLHVTRWVGWLIRNKTKYLITKHIFWSVKQALAEVKCHVGQMSFNEISKWNDYLPAVVFSDWQILLHSFQTSQNLRICHTGQLHVRVYEGNLRRSTGKSLPPSADWESQMEDVINEWRDETHRETINNTSKLR